MSILLDFFRRNSHAILRLPKKTTATEIVKIRIIGKGERDGSGTGCHTDTLPKAAGDAPGAIYGSGCHTDTLPKVAGDAPGAIGRDWMSLGPPSARGRQNIVTRG
jgi:hypothetical protein